MAEIIEEFPKHLGRPPTYDWATLTDGQARELTRGVDFESDPRSFRTLVHRVKKARGLNARTRIKGDTITIQFNEVAE
jgi:hypothetical protein